MKRNPFHQHGLYTVFQPIVDIKQKSIVAYEALTRSKDKRMNPLELFRRALHENRTIELDLYCIERAVRDMQKIRVDRCLFINAEPITLCEAFQKRQYGEKILKLAGPNAHRIVFELTQGLHTRDFPLLKKSVDLLRSYGCRFALDDLVGVGEKLDRLMALHPDFMKLDLVISQGAQRNSSYRAILKTLLGLSRKYRSTVIAEGVETVQQVKYLEKKAIPLYQGYIFGKPQKRPAVSILKN